MPCFFSMRASLPAEVVLPEPCSPTSMMTVGGLGLMLRRLSVPPISAVSSSSTILTTACAAVSVSSTSCPTARSLTRFTKSLTTLKLTSASNSAMRTSRIASFTSSSVSLPCPRSFLNIPCRRSDRFSKSISSPPFIYSLYISFCDVYRSSSSAMRRTSARPIGSRSARNSVQTAAIARSCSC